MQNDDRVVATNIERVDPVVPMTLSELAGSMMIGGVVGLLVAGSYLLLRQYVFTATLCPGDEASTCLQSPVYSTIVAMVVGAITGLTLLVRARIFRPLLVILGSTISLWILVTQPMVTTLVWYWTLVAMTILFALVYGLFAWMARIRSFIVAVIVTILLVVAVYFSTKL